MPINDNYDVFTRIKSATNNLYAKVFEIPFIFNELLWASTKQFVVRVHSHDSRGTWRMKEYAVGINRTALNDPTKQSICIGDLTPSNPGSNLVGVIENDIPTFYVNCLKDLKVGIQVTMCENKNFFKFFNFAYFDTDLSVVADKVEPVAAYTINLPNVPINGNTTNKQIFIGTGASGGWGTYAFGNGAGTNAASTNSLFIGNDVGKDSSGNDVTGVGIGAIPAITTAKGVSAFGRQALKVLTTGDYNNAFGNTAMNALTTGTRNNAFGFQALYHLVDGNNNIAFGDKAGSSEADGTRNTSSDNCIFIGNNTKSSTDIAQNEIVIGDGAVGKGDNTAQIGNTSVASLFVGDNRLVRVVAVPTSATATGIKGDISGDANFLYYCYDTNSWIRIPKDTTSWT